MNIISLRSDFIIDFFFCFRDEKLLKLHSVKIVSNLNVLTIFWDNFFFICSYVDDDDLRSFDCQIVVVDLIYSIKKTTTFKFVIRQQQYSKNSIEITNDELSMMDFINCCRCRRRPATTCLLFGSFFFITWSSYLFSKLIPVFFLNSWCWWIMLTLLILPNYIYLFYKNSFIYLT